MKKFNWFQAFGFGLVIWASLFVLAAIAFGFGIFASVWAQITIAIVIAAVTYGFASVIKADNPGQALGYGAMFAAIGIVLDLIISRQLVNGLYGMWTYYLSYAAILLAPSVQGALGSEPSTHAV